MHQELIESLGYELEFEDINQKKKRFSSDIGFVDLWNGKRGIVVGIYNTETKHVDYFKKISEEKSPRDPSSE